MYCFKWQGWNRQINTSRAIVPLTFCNAKEEEEGEEDGEEVGPLSSFSTKPRTQYTSSTKDSGQRYVNSNYSKQWRMTQFFIIIIMRTRSKVKYFSFTMCIVQRNFIGKPFLTWNFVYRSLQRKLKGNWKVLSNSGDSTITRESLQQVKSLACRHGPVTWHSWALCRSGQCRTKQ
jgi:hypothetical protein